MRSPRRSARPSTGAELNFGGTPVLARVEIAAHKGGQGPRFCGDAADLRVDADLGDELEQLEQQQLREEVGGDRAHLGDEADHPLPSRAQGTSPLPARAAAPRRCPLRAPPRYASPRCSRSPPAPRRPTRTRGRKLASGFSSSAMHLAPGLAQLQAEKRAGEIPPKYDEARQASVSTSLPSLSCKIPLG